MKLYKRYVRRMLTWSVFICYLAFGCLCYEDGYHVDDGNVRMVLATNNSEAVAKPKNKVKLPDGAVNVKSCFTGRYVAYEANGKLDVVSMADGRSRSLDVNGLNYFCWLPDRTRLMYVEKFKNGQEGYMKIHSYDADRGEGAVLKDNNGKEVIIPISNNFYDLEDVCFSCGCNIMYMRVGRMGYKNVIYKIDGSGVPAKVCEMDNKAGKMISLFNEDKLLIENPVEKCIDVLGEGTSITNADTILGTDMNDDVYLANSDESGKFSNLFIGNFRSKPEAWKVLNLEEPVDEKNVHVSRSGEVMVNDSFQGRLNMVEEGEEMRYRGVVKDYFEGGTVNQVEETLVITNIK